MTNFASDFKDKMKSKENVSAALLSPSGDDVALCCSALLKKDVFVDIVEFLF